jgi:hypothetical protein
MRLLERLFGRVPTIGELDARADALAAAMRLEDARTPLGQWTAEDVERYDMEQVGMAIRAGHLRDLGFGGAGVRHCGLHGDRCRP